ncbi:MAG: hypothetical protein ACYDH9_18035 [Limisphaerales bacterium]
MKAKHCSHRNLWMLGLLLYVALVEAQLPPLSFGSVQVVQPQTNLFFTVTYGNGIFVTASPYGVTLTSPDGVVWTAHHPPTNGALWASGGLAAGNSNFVGVGSDGSNSVVQLSPDGITWSRPVMIPSMTFSGYSPVTYGNGIYVAVGQASDGSAMVGTSSDGVSWSTQSFSGYGPLNAVTAGNGTFVAVGNSGAIFTSSDGFNWAAQLVLSGANIVSVVYGNGIFVAGAPAGTPNDIVTSRDGTDWTAHSRSASSFGADELLRIAYGGGLFVAQSQYLSASTNGVDWEILWMAYGGESPVSNIAYGAGTFVIVGGYGPIATLSRSYLPSGSRGAGGVFDLTVTGGGVGQHCRIQAATALPATSWVDLLSFTNQGSVINFLDTGATNYPRRFYRVVSP